MSKTAVLPIQWLDLTFAPKPWPFAEARRAEIDAWFAARRRENPALWNGRVLLLHEHRMDGGVFSGSFLETDYASFSAWRAWGAPDAQIRNCFGAAALVSADNAVLLGVMGPQTANAGRAYFPCGTPEPKDIVGDTVDLDVSVRREFKEETGLDPAGFDADSGWIMVVDPPLIAVIKVLRSGETASVLHARALAHLAHERQPELSDIRMVRGTADIDATMPGFVATFLAHHFALG